MQFMVLIYEDPKFYESMPEAELAGVIAGYEALAAEMREAGVMVFGAELQPARTAATVRVRQGKVTVTDGPFAETKEHLGGYFLLDCANMDEALKWAARCPSAPHGSIEVRPVVG